MIRSATPDDVPAIARLIRGLAEYEKLSSHCVFEDSDLRAQLFGARPGAEVLMAEEEGRAVGFALFFQSFSTFLARPGLYLEDLFVLPSERGRGHGKALFQRLAQIAVERGYGRFEWSVLNWNEPSIRFYRAMGSKPLDEWTMHRIEGDALRALAEGRPLAAE
ncbi:MAG TPA: GNAT family N-acetyltransferase [Myxococcaceae bacterium]|nr:GNAT family N-acetyltransferase [Myxococcaceae bacterium]